MRIKGREVCLLSDLQHVYEIIDWDKNTKLWSLKNDLGATISVFHNEFVPLSEADEELVKAMPDGRLVTVSEMIEKNLKWERPAFLSGKPAPSPEGPQAVKPAPSPERVAVDQDEAKVKVSELLAPCDSREAVAEAAAGYLGSSTAALLEKYHHLDNGRFRMVIGNRLRSIFK